MRRYLLILSTVVRCLVLEHGQKLLKSHSVHKMQKKRLAAGAPPGPRWGSLQRSPRHLGEGADCPSQRTPLPLSALRASPVLAP